MAFRKATKKRSLLRCAIFGPAGSGKTYSALAIATGMRAEGEKIALIDSEFGSSEKYGDRFDFDVSTLRRHTIDGYIAEIQAAATAGYRYLIIDSLTHAWKGLLAEVEKLARSKYRGNTWSAWSEGTPKQKGLINALLSYPGHLIATMRTKTEWQTTDAGNGKTRPVRVGLAPEQGKGIEYEFDVLMEISPDHVAQIIKDRTDKFQDNLIEKPGVDFGRDLIAWLNEGEEGEDPTPFGADDMPVTAEGVASLKNFMRTLGTSPDAILEIKQRYTIASLEELTLAQARALYTELQKGSKES